MNGIVETLHLFEENRNKYGFIKGNDGRKYYFNQDSLIGKQAIDTLFAGDIVSFCVEHSHYSNDRATHVKLEQHKESCVDSGFARPGISSRLDLVKADTEHLKAGSGELETIKKLSEVLLITRVGHHFMDQNSSYQFCLASVTSVFKQFIRESGEFFIIFSHFDNQSWQQKTLKVERELRKRKELADRRPLINFYILISNAHELRAKIDSVKGEPQAAIIPFSFEEILSCNSTQELTTCMLSRFSEYYFENNMLAENQAIDDDNLLFGDRGKIADSVVERCHQGNNSGIFGLRRSGKTSVLNAVLRRLTWEGIPYVLIESRTYETFSSWKNVLFEISCLVRAKMLGLERSPNETLDSFYSRLNLSSTEEEYEKRGPACFIDDITRYRGDNLLVIAIDEIELITYNTATSAAWKSLESYKGFWSALRGCGCPIVVCGVNSTINEISNLNYNGEQCDNPMYGRITDCGESNRTYLPAFTDEQTKTMINTLGRYSNIAFSAVYPSINRTFGGQPWAIRQFCSYVFNNIRDCREPSRVYEVSKATCDNLMRSFINSSTGIQLCQTILQHLSIYTQEYSLLKKIALVPDKYNTVDTNDYTSIDHLQKYGLIEYDPDTNYVSFCIDIIKEYIKKTESKSPDDMSNDERRQYVQDGIAKCEKKLKRYLLNYFTYASTPQKGRTLFFDTKQNCILRPKYGVVIDPKTCDFKDFFDHKKFIFYFFTLKKVISENWELFKANFESVGINQHKFIVCIEDLNAGRTDADHYDPENDTDAPDNWEISDQTMQAFSSAFNTLDTFFTSVNL